MLPVDTGRPAAPIRSSKLEEPDFAELVAMYVDEMPQRISGLTDCVSRRDWDRLGVLAHQIKGSAGSYGFDPLTRLADTLEHACRVDGRLTAILGAVDELIESMRRVEL